MSSLNSLQQLSTLLNDLHSGLDDVMSFFYLESGLLGMCLSSFGV